MRFARELAKKSSRAAAKFKTKFETQKEVPDTGQGSLTGLWSPIADHWPLIRRPVVRTIRRLANMQVAQIVQQSFIFFVHAAREAWIRQPPVSRFFRHILQDLQPLPDGLAAVRWHLFPPWQYVTTDVLPLLRRHAVPHTRTIAELILSVRRQIPQPPVVL